MGHIENAALLNPEHMIQEIRTSTQARDAIKVRLVLEHLGSMERPVQHRLVYEMLRADAEFTVPQLNRLVTHYPELCESLPVIRETLISHLIAHPELIIRNLRDPSISDKRVFIQMAGELKLDDAVDALMCVVRSSDDLTTLKAVIESLAIIGGPNALSTLTEFLYSPDRGLTVEAIRALRQVGTPAAMSKLAERMGSDHELDRMILGVFAEVQDAVSLDKLNDTLRSPHTGTRVFAKEQLVRIGEIAIPMLAANLQDANSDFVIHTLNVLGEIGSVQAIGPIRRLLSTEPPEANVRFAAYEALSQFPVSKGAFALAAGLTDREEHVCIAAARAIDRNLNDVLAAGIRNLVHNENDEARHIVKVIINAQVESLFLRLIDEDYFRRLALAYLSHAHRDICDYHVELLRKHGYDELADYVSGGDAGQVEQRVKVCAVDDSRVVLSIYRATLHELGFEPVVFERPADALQWLQQEKPAAVLTDLNMPKMSGLELATHIRRLYTADELPIVLVTTQSDVRADDAVVHAGINDVLSKPFNPQSLLAVLERYLCVSAS